MAIVEMVFSGYVGEKSTAFSQHNISAIHPHAGSATLFERACVRQREALRARLRTLAAIHPHAGSATFFERTCVRSAMLFERAFVHTSTAARVRAKLARESLVSTMALVQFYFLC